MSVPTGPDAEQLKPVATRSWANLETAIPVDSPGRLFQAEAIDHDGKVIGRSKAVPLGGQGR